jgi:hypothetical protein
MQAILTSPGDFVKYTQDKAIHYVTKLTGWMEDIAGSGVYRKEFRWGTSNRVRASWVELTEKNLTDVILDPNNDLFVDFRITLISGGPITINNIEVTFEQDPIAQDPYVGFVPVYTVADKGNISSITKIENFSFRPYQVNPLVVLYKELSFTINQLFGIDVMYARAVPMAIGKDIVLNEWNLYDVDEPKCIKVVVPNNEFPDSKLMFNPMGIDFEMPFEVHITKNYFEELFGVGTAPQKRDIVYMPLENRVYEVDSSYLYKDLMRTEIYWKVSLTKYQPKANRKETQNLREEFDVLTTSYQEEFQEELDLLEIKTTDPQQFDPKIGSKDYDPTRQSIADKLVIAQSKVNNYSLLLSESQYDLRSIFTGTGDIEAVKYRANVDLPSSSERSFSCWFKEITPNITIPKDSVKGGLILGPLVEDHQDLTFKLAATRKFVEGDVIKISKFNGFTVYGTWKSTNPVSGGYNYTISVRKDVIEFLNLYYPNWSGPSGSGYVAEKTFENVLFNGYDSETLKGLRISIYASRYIMITRNEEKLMYILKNNLVQDYWYAIFINMSNFYRQLSVDLWVRKWNETNPAPPQTTDLENIYSTVQTIEPLDMSVDTNYNLLAANLVSTNIRLYDKIETDQIKQVNMLNQAIVQDAQFSIIIDNAIPRLNLPWIANTK